jgi:two-component system, chemotaxis family, chemotaxis protein CheY
MQCLYGADHTGMRRLRKFRYHSCRHAQFASTMQDAPKQRDVLFHYEKRRQNVLKVVIIDANAISRNLLGSILTSGGHDVVGDANTTPAGLARMIKLQPQVVCIDIGQAEEGMALLDTLRDALPKVLLFFVSGKMDAATVQDALAHGVHGFIVKPFNAATVLTSIRNTIVKLARQHQAAAGSQG